MDGRKYNLDHFFALASKNTYNNWFSSGNLKLIHYAIKWLDTLKKATRFLSHKHKVFNIFIFF